MTPLEIRLLLHIHCYPRTWENAHAPAVMDAIEGFKRENLIQLRDSQREADEHPYELSMRGKAMVHALTHLPLPVMAWRMPGSDTVIL